MTDPARTSATRDSAPLLRDNPLGTSQSTFGVDEYVEGPSTGETPRTVAPLHLHREEDEAWYVLEGELAVRLGDRVVRAGPGTAVWSRPKVVHTFWNPSSQPTRYLLIMGPKTRAFLLALHQVPPLGPQEIASRAEECGIELLE